MKTLQLINCRKCGKMYFAGEKRVSFAYGDEVYELIRRVARCAECKLGSDRSPGGRNKKHER
jgi:hypothetical protein